MATGRTPTVPQARSSVIACRGRRPWTPGISRAPTSGVRGARDEGHLRALLRSAGRPVGRVHLLVRVHVLPDLCGAAERRLPELFR
jgi:hypothetical protein